MSAIRPLPSRPSLEFEHKEAKALLRRLKAGDRDALARAQQRHPEIGTKEPARMRLADAQLVIAREYGFTSWPRLVRYFGDVERQRHNDQTQDAGDLYEGSVRSLLARYQNRRPEAARTLAAYVPRCFGLRPADVFAIGVTEDEARLAVARQYGSPSWEVLQERAAVMVRLFREDAWTVSPFQRAGRAMEAADLDALRNVVAAHPELMHRHADQLNRIPSLLASALFHERKQGRAAMAPIVAWLVAQGFDVQDELNRHLCGRMRMDPDTVRWLLQRGADPDAIMPNGISVLEHAIIRYWNGAAVDLVAARAKPREALWVAAGLGDVDGVRRSLDGRGKPTAAARRHRPDFTAAGPAGFPQRPHAGDEEILMEAFLVAMFNGRTAVLEYMVSRGFPVNSLVYGSPPIWLAAGNGWTSVVECLVRCGADLDLPGRQPDMSARQAARYMLEEVSQDAERRRIVELCGMDPDAVLAERDARPMPPPAVEPALQEALDLAGDDAARLGQSDVRPDNLLFGLLRAGGHTVMFVTHYSRMDLDRFRADVLDRVRFGKERVQAPPLPLHPDAQAVLDAAIAAATERRHEAVRGDHLLYALTREGRGPVAELLARYGSSAAAVNEMLGRGM